MHQMQWDVEAGFFRIYDVNKQKQHEHVNKYD